MTVFLKNLDLTKIKTPKRPATTPNRAQITPFPVKLYKMLEEVEQQGDEHIVSWHPDGRSFHVHHPEKFVEQVLPCHFKQTKYKSFQRQLNFYGFQRITSGPLEGSYGHPNFVRGNLELCKEIKRQASGAASSAVAAATNEPTPLKKMDAHRISLTESVVAAVDMLNEEDSNDNDNDNTDDVALPDPSFDFEPMEIMAQAEQQKPKSRSAASRRDSFQMAMEALSAIESKRRESIHEGTRLSFVGKKFFFLPVEFTDLYGV